MDTETTETEYVVFLPPKGGMPRLELARYVNADDAANHVSKFTYGNAYAVKQVITVIETPLILIGEGTREQSLV